MVKQKNKEKAQRNKETHKRENILKNKTCSIKESESKINSKLTLLLHPCLLAIPKQIIQIIKNKANRTEYKIELMNIGGKINALLSVGNIIFKEQIAI